MKPREIYDPIRKKLVPSTPEESVRQNIIQYLLQMCKVPPQMVEVEFSLNKWAGAHLVAGARADILVWKKDDQGELYPWLLVECKAPKVKLDEKIQLQVSRYLNSVKPLHIMFTNGPDSQYFQFQGAHYVDIAGIPRYPN